jgi:hypothetical protein
MATEPQAIPALRRAFLLALALPFSIVSSGCNALLGNNDVTGTATDGGQVARMGDGSLSGSSDAAADGTASGRDGSVAATDGGTDATLSSDGGASDARVADGAVDAAADGPTVGPLCDPATAFGTPTLVPGIPAGGEVHGRLSPDEKTIWFDTSQGTIYVGTRDSVGGVFSYKGLAADGGAVAFTSNDVFPTVSDDLKTLYFLNGDTNLLSAATRTDTTLPFLSDGGPLPLTSPLNAQYRAPFVRGATLYFGLFATGLSGSVIYFSDISGNGFTVPQAVPGFPIANAGTGGPDGERFPVASQDGNTIYFLDDGTGTIGEIYMARRGDAGVPFTTASRVTELSSGSGEQPLWLSFDQCRLYFMSFRQPPGLYVASH